MSLNWSIGINGIFHRSIIVLQKGPLKGSFTPRGKAPNSLSPFPAAMCCSAQGNCSSLLLIINVCGAIKPLQAPFALLIALRAQRFLSGHHDLRRSQKIMRGFTERDYKRKARAFKMPLDFFASSSTIELFFWFTLFHRDNC